MRVSEDEGSFYRFYSMMVEGVHPRFHEPPQGHEYQFNLDSDEGRQTLAAMLALLQAHVPSPLASPTGASSSG